MDTTTRTKESPSSLNLFNTCQRAYYYRYIKGIEAKQTRPALQVGKAVHAALAEWMLKRNVKDAVDVLEASWNGDHDWQTLTYYREVIQAYVEANATQLIDYEPLEVDGKKAVELQLETDDSLIRLDLLVRSKARKGVYLKDYKTTSRMPNANYWQDFMLGYQPVMYRDVLADHGIHIDGIIQDVLVVRKPTKAKPLNVDFETKTFRYDDEVTEEVMYSVRDTINQIEIMRKCPKQMYRMQTNSCTKPWTCEFLEICRTKPSKQNIVIEAQYKERKYDA